MPGSSRKGRKGAPPGGHSPLPPLPGPSDARWRERIRWLRQGRIALVLGERERITGPVAVRPPLPIHVVATGEEVAPPVALPAPEIAQPEPTLIEVAGPLPPELREEVGAGELHRRLVAHRPTLVHEVQHRRAVGNEA